ncbi:MAG: hypothetical protein WKF84_14350 [Pyrinomonadaceae bacterium]
MQSITGEVPRNRDQTLFLPKIDWIINDSNTFTAVFNRLRAEAPAGVQSQAVVNRGVSSFGDDFVNVDSLNLAFELYDLSNSAQRSAFSVRA